MDFEAPDGSQISCREVWTQDGAFDYTTISAYIDGQPYVTRSDQVPEEIDIAEALTNLQPVPLECIQPLPPADVTIAPDFNSEYHYLKAPSYTYEDCLPGNTFVADCVLNEVKVLERLKQHPHWNISTYFGCVVKEGRISHICLQKYPHSLLDHLDEVLDNQGVQACKRGIIALRDGIDAAVAHLHFLGLAHNDVNIDNVRVDESGMAVLIDFDSCLPFGERLMKGVSQINGSGSEAAVSSKENDFRSLDDLYEDTWSKYMIDDTKDP